MFAQMFRITFNKSSHILHHIHVFIISRYNWSTMRVTRITLFAPRIFLQVSVLFWTILYPSSEPSSELNLFQNTFLLSLFSLQVSVLFWTVPFRSEFPYPSPEPNPSRTKSLPEHLFAILIPSSSLCSVPFWISLSKSRTKSLQNQISSRTLPFCSPYSFLSLSVLFWLCSEFPLSKFRTKSLPELFSFCAHTHTHYF